MGGVRNWTSVRQGFLLVIRRVATRQDGQALWECRCDCGTLCVKSSGNLRMGAQSCSVSCGVSRSNRRRAKHGVAHGKEWRAWSAAKQRCHNPKNPQYKNYGARGITMCEQWRTSFATFYAHLGPAPATGHQATLDRIDNNGHYEPGNVQWVSMKVQRANTRSTRWVELGDRRVSVPVACEEFGLPYTTVDARWRRGLRGWALVAPKQS